jgi:uncharacterized protein (DUF1015 family)
MAKIFPFNGLIYNKEKVGKFSKVLIPPYDIISKEDQEKYYRTHPYNCIRLTLGKDFPEDTEFNNKYSRANSFFNAWIKNDIFKKDEEESIYAYEQKFSYKGKKYVRLGFICLFKLEDMETGKVFPHENTLPKPKIDRLSLLRATAANFEPIFALYIDEEDKIPRLIKKNIKRKPLVEAKDMFGIHNKLWKISGKPALNKLIKEMAGKQVFIADGHHRYESSLKYRNEMRTNAQKSTGDEPYNFIMTYFTNTSDKGLVIMPIHRLILDLSLKEKINLENRLLDCFDIEEIKFSKGSERSARKKLLKAMSKAAEGEHFFGMYLHGENKYSLLKLKYEKLIDKYTSADKLKEWKKLDITILHSLVIKDILGITDTDIEAENAVKYVHDDDKAFDLVKEGKYQIAFFLNPTKIEQVTALASKYEKMPQKSTFFFPKLLTGLVMYKMMPPEKYSF